MHVVAAEWHIPYTLRRIAIQYMVVAHFGFVTVLFDEILRIKNLMAKRSFQISQVSKIYIKKED